MPGCFGGGGRQAEDRPRLGAIVRAALSKLNVGPSGRARGGLFLLLPCKAGDGIAGGVGEGRVVRRWGDIRRGIKTGDAIAGFTGIGETIAGFTETRETNAGFTGGLGRGGFRQWRDCGTVWRPSGGLVVRNETIGVRIGDGNGWHGKEDNQRD